MDRLDSVLMECEDANSGGSAIQYGGWQKLIDGAWTDVPQDTGQILKIIEELFLLVRTLIFCQCVNDPWWLTLSSLGKIFSRHYIEIFFLSFP